MRADHPLAAAFQYRQTLHMQRLLLLEQCYTCVVFDESGRLEQ